MRVFLYIDFFIFNAVLDYVKDPYIDENTSRNFRLILENNIGQQQWLNIKWHVPEGWKVSPGVETSVYLDASHMGKTQLSFDIIAESLQSSKYDLIIEITSNGHPTKALIPVTLLKGAK